MRSSSLFIAIALSVSGLACAGRGVQIDTTRMSRHSAEGGLGGLWVGSQEAQSHGDIQLTYRGDDATSDLWMKRGPELNTENMREKQTPRLDWALNRLTPDTTSTFVEASHPTKARQRPAPSRPRRLRAQGAPGQGRVRLDRPRNRPN